MASSRIILRVIYRTGILIDQVNVERTASTCGSIEIVKTVLSLTTGQSLLRASKAYSDINVNGSHAGPFRTLAHLCTHYPVHRTSLNSE